MNKLGHILHQSSAWPLMLALIAAPWALGSLPPFAIAAILTLLSITTLIWLLALLLLRRPPVVNLASALGFLLLLQGWLMTLNPIAYYDPVAHQFPLLSHLSFPGTIDAHSSRLAMLSFTVLFAIFHVVLDHARAPAFRRLLLWTSAITGASIAILGTLQFFRITPFLLDLMQLREGQPFGPFNYHANAGSLLMLTFPCAMALAALAYASARRPLALASAALAFMILLGSLLNTSRFTAALSVLLLMALSYAIWRLLHAARTAPFRWKWLLLVSLTLIAALAATAFVMPDKWRRLAGESFTNSSRFYLWRIDAHMAADAGLFGHGPGTFPVLFPISPHFDTRLYERFIITPHTPGNQVSIWSHAHNDFLQTVIEWGWIGGMLWAALVLMTLFIGARELLNRNTPAHMRLLILAPFTALAAVSIHSLLDFPFQILALQLYATCFAALLWSVRGGRLFRGQTPQNDSGQM